MTPDLEVSRDIAASPEAVFAAITDVTRMGQWSPETQNAEWNEGHNGPALGAMFTGHNQFGENEWSTEAKIVGLVANERFVFDCMVGDFVFATWSYAIEATDSGCRVTESWQDHRPDEVKEMSLAISGVEDRVVHNRATIEVTLAALAAEVE